MRGLKKIALGGLVLLSLGGMYVLSSNKRDNFRPVDEVVSFETQEVLGTEPNHSGLADGGSQPTKTDSQQDSEPSSISGAPGTTWTLEMLIETIGQPDVHGEDERYWESLRSVVDEFLPDLLQLAFTGTEQEKFRATRTLEIVGRMYRNVPPSPLQSFENELLEIALSSPNSRIGVSGLTALTSIDSLQPETIKRLGEANEVGSLFAATLYPRIAQLCSESSVAQTVFRSALHSNEVSVRNAAISSLDLVLAKDESFVADALFLLESEDSAMPLARIMSALGTLEMPDQLSRSFDNVVADILSDNESSDDARNVAIRVLLYRLSRQGASQNGALQKVLSVLEDDTQPEVLRKTILSRLKHHQFLSADVYESVGRVAEEQGEVGAAATAWMEL